MFDGGGSIPAEIVSVQACSSPSQAVVVHMGVSSASGGVHLTIGGDVFQQEDTVRCM